MAIKPSLSLKLGQQLRMTPQLQQAIKLLQLSNLDLELEIQEALDSIIMLEEVDPEVSENSTEESSLDVPEENIEGMSNPIETDQEISTETSEFSSVERDISDEVV